MASKWVVVPLEQLKAQTKSAFAMGPFGSKIKAENFTTVGVPVIKGGNLNATYLDESDFDFLTQEKADELESAKARRLDIVITHRGTLGQVGLIPENSKYEEYVVSQSQLKMSFDINRVDPYFVYYFLKSPLGQSRLLSNVSQVGVPAIAQALTSVRAIEIPIPENRSEQVRISSILRSLDAKISLNCGINQTLEAMAQAIFKSWFVDFDPVKAKIAAIEQGEEPLRAAMRTISGKTDAELDQMPREHHDQLVAAAELFPDAMEEPELGDIPKGWEVKRVGDLIELAYGKALKSTDRKQGSVPVYGSGGVTGYHNEALVPHGAIIVGRKGTVGRLYWEDEPFFPIDTTFYVKPKVLPMTYCFYAMQTLGLDKMNTDAAVPGLNRENVYRLELVKPPTSVLNAFDGLIGQTRKAMRANEIASQSLAELRDSLLPKLLSGELAIDKMAGLVDTTGAI
ncbi:restriction endonuclease subunit S [Serratia nevei]|uniref:restriction endonuclease subunit S n=1 Tax=Serratia nevei TaxID=2703794 RepID=UPI0029E2D8ED|nr:restriction endonuclease subunit S [Serratia marcescens]